MKITSITIFTNKHSTDKIRLKTDLPSTFTFAPEQVTCFDVDATVGTGEDYVKANFPGIPYEILKIS